MLAEASATAPTAHRHTVAHGHPFVIKRGSTNLPGFSAGTRLGVRLVVTVMAGWHPQTALDVWAFLVRGTLAQVGMHEAKCPKRQARLTQQDSTRVPRSQFRPS